MKFTCERSVLLKEITIANEIISSKNAISILSNIYLEAGDGGLTIKATDMKVNFETKVPVEVIEPGSVTVYADKFYGILNSIPDGEIEFEQKDSRINIKTSAKKAKFQLKSMASEKFPEFTVPAKEFFEIPIKNLKDMIKETIFAISIDETRYYMNGIYFEKNENSFKMVATDGRRLAFISKPAAEGSPAEFPGVIVPSKIFNIVMRRSGDEGMAGICVSDKTIFIKFGSYSLSSVLIEGEFPNYRRIIPEKQEKIFKVNRLEMLEALKRVSLLVEEKSHRVYLGLSTGMVSIYCEENDIGNAREEISCVYEGEEHTIALNYRYIEEPFKVASADEISIMFTDPSKTLTIMPVPEQDFFHLVMPMQQE